MGDNDQAINVKGVDRVAVEALGSTGMEEARVLVSFEDSAKLSPLLPAGSPFPNEGRQRVPIEHMELELPGGEIMRFLKKIKKVNQEFAVIFNFGVEEVGAFPNLSGCAKGFQGAQPGQRRHRA
jgi:hypothetical protein